MKRKSKLTVRFILLGAILVAMIYLISLQLKMNTLRRERDELMEIVDDYQASIATMQQELLLPKEEYIAKYAREILGYYRYSDYIFKEKTK